jgi:hypothetical protein
MIAPANDWDLKRLYRCFINRYPVLHFVLESAYRKINTVNGKAA